MAKKVQKPVRQQNPVLSTPSCKTELPPALLLGLKGGMPIKPMIAPLINSKSGAGSSNPAELLRRMGIDSLPSVKAATEEAAFYNQFLKRVREDNANARELGVSDEKAVCLVLAYGDWCPTFKKDGSTMSIEKMMELLDYISKVDEKDHEILNSCYGLDGLYSRKRPERMDILRIWDKYRTFSILYAYSSAFREAADKLGVKIDADGLSLCEKFKVFYLWLCLIFGQKKLFFDDNHGKKTNLKSHLTFLTPDVLIGVALSGMFNQMQEGDIVWALIKKFIEFFPENVQNKVLKFAQISEEKYSENDVSTMKELKRNLFRGDSKYNINSFCTKSGISDIDATLFIEEVRRVQQKGKADTWEEWMHLKLYEWLQSHPDFQFGHGSEKKTLAAWEREHRLVSFDSVSVAAEWVVFKGFVDSLDNVNLENLKMLMNPTFELHSRFFQKWYMGDADGWRLSTIYPFESNAQAELCMSLNPRAVCLTEEVLEKFYKAFENAGNTGEDLEEVSFAERVWQYIGNFYRKLNIDTNVVVAKFLKDMGYVACDVATGEQNTMEILQKNINWTLTETILRPNVLEHEFFFKLFANGMISANELANLLDYKFASDSQARLCFSIDKQMTQDELEKLEAALRRRQPYKRFAKMKMALPAPVFADVVYIQLFRYYAEHHPEQVRRLMLTYEWLLEK